MPFLAIHSPCQTSDSFTLRFRILSTRSSFGTTHAFTIRSPRSSAKTAAKYLSVSKVTEQSGTKSFQRSLLVKIPTRRSPTGRVKVNGAKFSLLSLSLSWIFINAFFNCRCDKHQYESYQRIHNDQLKSKLIRPKQSISWLSSRSPS